MHIGSLIKQRVREQKKTSVWLAQSLSCSRTNVYKLYDKKSVDTDVLIRISKILDFDFFSLYSTEVKKGIVPWDKHVGDCPMGQARRGLSLIGWHANQLETLFIPYQTNLSFLCF